MDLVLRYQPDYLYADGDWSGSDEFLQTKPFLAWLFNDSPVSDRVVINDRWGNTTRTHHGGTYLCEYDPECQFDHPFAVTQGFGKSFGYNRNEERHITNAKWCDWNLKNGDGHCKVSTAVTYADTELCCTHTNATGLVHLLVRTVAKGGNLEMNFGPAGDGLLPNSMVVPLLGTGRWLETNGEAIYSSRAFPFGRTWPACTEDSSGQVGYCITAPRGDNRTIYVILLRWPDDHVVVPAARASQWYGKKVLVGLLGATTKSFEPPGTQWQDKGLVVPLDRSPPSELRCDLDQCHAYVLKLSVVGETIV